MKQMLGSGAKSEDGMSLFVSRKIWKVMNGDVGYSREDGKSVWIISAKFAGAVQSDI